MDEFEDINIEDFEEMTPDQDVLDFIERTQRDPLEEKRREEQRLKEIGAIGVSEKYHPEMAASMEDVEANPERFIIPECIPACKVLWDKNVYTYMVSDYDNGEAWIELFADGLSEENLAYIKELYKRNDLHLFSYHSGSINIGVKGFGYQAQKTLLEIASGFKMQDVYKYYAYIDLETALFRVGCTKKVKNPDYHFMSEPDGEDVSECLAYYEWIRNGAEDQEWIEVFDETKVKQPLEANFVGTDFYFDLENERVYLSEYHYKKHLKYLEYVEKMKKSDQFTV